MGLIDRWRSAQATRVQEERPIELRLQHISQLFNNLDPSPFWEQDLDDHAVAFLITWTAELPEQAPLRLVLHLPAAEAAAIDPASLTDAVQRFFGRLALNAGRRLRGKLRDGRLQLLIGLGFLFVCMVIRQFILDLGAQGLPVDFVTEGLLISGWVGMWGPIETFLYEWWPIRREQRLMRRLAAMPVEIRPVA